MTDDMHGLREIVARGEGAAVGVFEHSLPAVAVVIDKLTAAERARAVVVLADRNDDAGRAFTEAILARLKQPIHEGGEPLFYTVQPAAFVAAIFSDLGLVPMPPLLTTEPVTGIRVAIVLDGMHHAFIWNRTLSQGGTA